MTSNALIAAGWIEGLGPLLVVAFWIIRQVLTAISEQKEKAGPDSNDELDPPAKRAKLGQRQTEPAAAGDVRSEVEEFLRRLEGAGQDLPEDDEATAIEDPERMAPTRRPIDPFEEPPRHSPKPKAERPPKQTISPQQTPSTKPSEPLEPLLAIQEVSASRSERSPSLELRHLPESQLAENAAHLGENIAKADDRVEARLHQKFDHEIGTLSARRESNPTPESKDSEPRSGASRIKHLLSKPGGMREAVVLGEILRRPSDNL